MSELRDQPLGFLNMGRTYHLAASHLYASQTGAAFEPHPVRQCAIIAIELYLKAWLLAHAQPEDSVRKFYHRVCDLGEAAEGFGFKLSPEDYDLLWVIQNDMSLISDRYIETDSGRNVPNVERTLEVCRTFWPQVLAKQQEDRPEFRLVNDAVLRP